MLFSALIYCSEDLIDSLSPEEMEELMSHHRAFHQRTKGDKSFAAAAKLMSTGTAVTVHQESDDVIVTDGPFAETKEQFRGFYLIECDSLDEAVEAVKLLPLKQHRIEIRPVDFFEGADFRNGERIVLNAT